MSLKKDAKIIIVILFILPILIFMISIPKFKMEKIDINEICFDQNCFDVKLALTIKEQTEGLMFKESLEENSGMLFIFDRNQIHKFWMKDMIIPLDIIWINSDKEIIYIEYNTPPCLEEPCKVYGPDEESKYVLEINSGISNKINLEIGQKAEINLKN